MASINLHVVSYYFHNMVLIKSICIFQMSRDEEKGEEVVAQTAAGEAIGRALTDTEPGRLLQYTCKAPAAPEGYQNRLRVVYSQVCIGCLKFKCHFSVI